MSNKHENLFSLLNASLPLGPGVGVQSAVERVVAALAKSSRERTAVGSSLHQPCQPDLCPHEGIPPIKIQRDFATEESADGGQ